MADFKPAFAFALMHEDPTCSGKVTEDAGGRTRFGIAGKFHPDLPEEFFTGPAEEALAEAEKIEERDYWQSMRLAEVENQNVANKLFDMGVNMGVRQAAIYAQRAANYLLGHGADDPSQTEASRLLEDGVIGNKTLAAINNFEPKEYYQSLCELSEAHYRHVATVNPAQAVNLRGWLKRAQA
ncbi:MAG TPA: glycosyl hydrolase 108 family protein [Candidatus Angelobacter sp.]|nr:glycosyl hydrolase 108 family protein [Candidatus Angelobacter sp.]